MIDTTPRTHVVIALLRAHRRSGGEWFERGGVLQLLNDVDYSDDTLRDTIDALEEARVMEERNAPDDARRTQYRLLLDPEDVDRSVEERML